VFWRIILLHLQGRKKKVEVVGISETCITTYKYYNPEDTILGWE
jgi:hypothetical protein